MSPHLLSSIPSSPDLRGTSVPDIQLAIARDLLDDNTDVSLTGYTLSLGGVVGVARHKTPVSISSSNEIRSKIDQSVAFLQSKVGASDFYLSLSLPLLWCSQSRPT